MVVECGCVKISVALLRQPFQLFPPFFKKFDICVRKSVLRCCVTPFQLFSPKFYRYVSSSVLHCCISKDSCIRRKLNYFGGRMWMCENQCCIVASAFSAFSHLFSKNFIYAFENQCCVVASPLFRFFYRCVSSSVLHCCIREDSCIRRKLSLFGARMRMCENQCCVVASAFSAFSQRFKKI